MSLVRPRLVLLALLALLAVGGDDERGYELLKQGKYQQAAEAFAAAIDKKGATAELCYNHALALWKSGKPDDAETAAERAATLSDGKLAWLRDGIVGALRYEKAKQQQQQDLDQALQLARQARDAFERAATAPGAGEELARNLERALALVDELEKKKKQEDPKKDENKDDKKDDQKDEKKPDSRPQSEPQSQPQSQPQEQDEPQSRPSSSPEQQQDQKQEPESQEPKKDEQKQAEQQQGKQDDKEQKEQQQEAKQDPQGKKSEAPGEQKVGELTPEQQKRLLEALEKLEEEKQKLRLLQKAQRPKVDKDW